jgi:WhiB family redox-sensing transcriptional regulator
MTHVMTQDELDQAACADKDVNIFFPEGPPNAPDNSTRYAKAICATCPVVASCLQQAIDEKRPGVWGGTTEAERKAMRLNIRTKP